MLPKSHKDAVAKTGAAETPPVTGVRSNGPASPPVVEQLLNVISNLPIKTADGLVAAIAFSANQTLATQIQLVHGVGQYVREHSMRLASAGEIAPAGPVREAFAIVARLQAKAADVLSEAALMCGRNFGRLAFAFPVPDRRC